MSDPHKVMDAARSKGMGQFGRILRVKDLPPESVIIEYVLDAMKLDEEGVKLPTKFKDQGD